MKIKYILFTLALIFLQVDLGGQDLKKGLIGKWNLKIKKDNTQLPSWLEVYKSGNGTLVGRFVYAFGSARPIGEIKIINERFKFSIPPQWEGGTKDMKVVGRVTKNGIAGKMTCVDGKPYTFRGRRARKLKYEKNTMWGTPVALFNGKNLQGWKVKGNKQWQVNKGILKNNASGGNVICKQKFKNFKLHAEFRYPKGSTIGIYLRGRYEVQIEDNFGKEPSSTLFGGIYGFLSPNEMVAKKPGQWQEYDITLIGRRVTVIANGKAIIVDQVIPGITGGALDNNEAQAGPIFIQGDHGPIEFRNITITPALEK